MTEPSPSEITQALEDLKRGDASAQERFWPLVYEQLRGLARREMEGERRRETFQPTALVHEAYLRLFGSGETDWKNRAYFFAAAGHAMRRILVDRARARGRAKRGGGRERVTLSGLADAPLGPDVDLLDLEAAISKLERIDESKASIVTLRHLLGLSIEETAAALDLSTAKVRKDWTFAKAWLRAELSE